MTFLHGVETVEVSSGGRPISTPSSSVIGIVGTAPYADPAVFPLDTPVLMTSGSDAIAKALLATVPNNPAPGASGTLPGAIDGIYQQTKAAVVVVRVAASADAAAQSADVVGVQANTTGAWAFINAQSMLGVKPKILIAPGFTHQYTAGVANAVAAALLVIAYRLRGIVVKDGPDDTDAHATADSVLMGDMRLYLVDPFVKIQNSAGAIVAVPSSARVAGLIAANDQNNGFWWSPSNQVLQGVLGTARPIEFNLSDPTSEANVLNAANVATIVNQNGFRLWGNRTGAVDLQWAFLSVRRTYDVIEDAVEAAYQWAMDRPQSAGLLAAVVEELSAYLRTLKSRGAVLGGIAWLDPDLNTPSVLEAGQAYVDYDAEPPAPLERLSFSAYRNPTYYSALVAAVQAAAQTN